MPTYCFVCRSRNSEKKYTLPNPNRVDLHDVFDKWVDFINNPNHKSWSREKLYKTVRVCAKHFKREDFTGIYPRTLDYFAVPSIRYNAHASDIDENENSSFETSVTVTPSTSYGDDFATDSFVTDELRAGCTSGMSFYSEISNITSHSSATRSNKQVYALKKKVKRLRTKKEQLQSKLKKANNIITNYKFQSILERMSNEAATFINCQFRQDKKKNKGYRFTRKEKVFSLTLL